MAWYDKIDFENGRLVEGDGFSLRLRLLGPGGGGIRYLRDGQTCSLFGELVDMTKRFGRTWLILSTWGLVFATPRTLEWDDGAKLSPEESDQVRNQISWALGKIKWPHEFEVTDGEPADESQPLEPQG